ncbi:uncharacterized protein LOC126322530 [Schistocerca gregaria]|uniref:uncharacterized protein LOC126322530 n=1 Tax=Schistocerca gregaria TaxID=7010 RepID=UPI00211E5426|nr:uncharacterized protein LOC126322530 [Schistocerca gregaria]XP_049850343.1 uncharacterized protein LOC126322530 [Schistocerca gregaria]
MTDLESTNVLDATQLIGEESHLNDGSMPVEEATIDVGNLVVMSYQVPSDERFEETATRLTQELINRVFCLSVEKTNLGPMVILPPPRIPIPREKSVPVPRPETRWEKFAKAKGIRKRKKMTKVWDQETGTWKRTWGKDSIKKDEDWLVEYDPEKMGECEDPFIKKAIDKKERVLKQKKRELSNRRAALVSATKKALGSKTATPLVIGKLAPTAKGLSKAHISRSIDLAQRSTRSMGTFDVQRPDEPLKKKRKALPQTSEAEKQTNERVLKGIMLSKQGDNAIDKEKMANQVIREERKKKRLELQNRTNQIKKKKRR